MPVTIKTGVLNYKDSYDQYVGVDVVSDNTTASRVAAINSAGATQVNAVLDAGAQQLNNIGNLGSSFRRVIEEKGEDVLESIPDDYTELADEVGNLKSAIDEETEYIENKLDAIAEATTDQTETITRTDFSPAWALGVCLLDGTTSASTGYAYTTTTEIPVQAGDKITCGDSRDVSKASMRYVTCYNGNTVQPGKGEESTTEFTVPYGVTRVVVTASSGAMTNSYYIKRYRTTVTYAMKDNLAKYEAEEMHGWEE